MQAQTGEWRDKFQKALQCLPGTGGKAVCGHFGAGYLRLAGRLENESACRSRPGTSFAAFLCADEECNRRRVLHLRPVLRYRIRIMTDKTSPESETSQRKAEVERQAAKRAERSAEQLRANLQRRKAQVRARREGRADETDGLPASSGRSAASKGKDAD